MAFGACAMSSAPSGRAPVPQSNMKQAPPLVVTSTHEVLPPKRTVLGPGGAIDHRGPQHRLPTLVLTSTHEVLPPKRTVLGPGVAIDPRVPQNRTRTLPPVPLFVVHVESVEIPRELRSPDANVLGLTTSRRLFQGSADLRDPVQAVAGAGALQSVA